MHYFTKSSVTIFTLLVAGILYLTTKLLATDWCKNDQLCTYLYWSDGIDKIIIVFFGFVILILPITLISFFFSEAIFEAWKWFAIWAVPVVLILTYFISGMSSGGGVGVVSFHPGLVYFPLLYGSFFLISIVIIVWKFIKLRKN